jgi:hypothetical protein
MLTSFRQKGAIDHTTAALIFGIAAVAIVGMLGFFYLQQVVHTASEGEDVQQLEANIADLKEKQRVLELEGAQLRSLKNVEGDAQELNLVPTEKVSYLAPVPDHLAARLP